MLVVACGIPAQGSDVEPDIVIENLLQLLGKLGTALQPLSFRQVPQVEVSPGALVVPGMTGFQEGIDGTLRRLAIQRILGLRLRRYPYPQEKKGAADECAP